MKLIALVFVVLFVTSCDNDGRSKLAYLYNQAANAEVTDKKIFLGLEFGMNNDEFDRRMRELMNEDQAYRIGDGTYKCEIKNEHGIKYIATLYPEFYNGKLFLLRIKIEDDISSDIKGEFISMYSSFNKVHKDYNYEILKDGDEREYYAFKNNIVVNFYENIDSYIEYINAPVFKKYNREQSVKDSISLLETF